MTQGTPETAAPGTSEVGTDSSIQSNTRRMAVLTLVSRGTGFIRIWVVLNVLGRSVLNDVYQSTNYIPNLLFELVAAGALQAALIPAITSAYARGDDAEGDGLATSVMAWGTALLSVGVVAGLVFRTQLLEFSFGKMEDPETKRAAIELGTFMLWFFLPQVILYLANAISTATLNARDRFALPAVSPLFNNVIVIATYLLFDHMRNGAQPSLDLSNTQKLVLAGGTSLGVIVFCLAPVIANFSGGFRLRRPWSITDPRLRAFGGQAGWAVLLLAASQVLFFAIMRFANTGEGNFSIWQTAWQVFLLPHTVLAVPILTTRFPSLARAASAERWREFAATFAVGTRSITAVAALAGGVLFAAGLPIARVISLSDRAGSPQALAHGVAAFGPGLVGFGLFLYFARVAYSLGDMKGPALVNIAATACGITALIVLGSIGDRMLSVAQLATVYSAVQIAGALLILALVARKNAEVGDRVGGLAYSCGARVIGGLVGAAAGRLVVDRFGVVSVGDAIVAGLVGAVVVSAAFFAVLWAITGNSPRETITTIGGAEPTRRAMGAT